MQKNKFWIIIVGCVFIFNIFCSDVEFVEIKNAHYFIEKQNAIFNCALRVFYRRAYLEITLNRFFCKGTKRNAAQYVSTNDMYAKILEKISPDNVNKKIKIEAMGCGEIIAIRPGYYYNSTYLYYRNSLYVTDVTEQNNE